jgi:hypothetical protein
MAAALVEGGGRLGGAPLAAHTANVVALVSKYTCWPS